MQNSLLSIGAGIFFSLAAFSQNKLSHDDYARAVGFLWDNVNNKTAFNLHIETNWFPDSSGLWYVSNEPGRKTYLKIDLTKSEKSDLFNHDKLAAILTDTLGEQILANDLPIDQIEYINPSQLQLTCKDLTFILNVDKNTISRASKKEEKNEKEQLSPDGKWAAYQDNHNLFIRNTETGKSRQLSFSGTKEFEYASWYGWGDIMKGEGSDRPEHFSVNWSEDSKWIYTGICDLRTAKKMYLLDWSVDTLYRPELLSYYRGSPGDTTMVYQNPVFFNIETGAEIKPALPRSVHINAASMRWSKKPGKAYLLKQNRGYQNLYLYRMDLGTKHLDTLYSESSTTNIDNFMYRLSEKRNFIFFLSEKSGWRQLYSINLNTKEVKALTSNHYYINSIDHLDELNNRILFRASGKESNLNPYLQNLYSISFDGSNLQRLTAEDNHHQISISPDGKYFVDNYSTANIPTTTALRKASNGEVLLILGRASTSGLTGWTPPELFTAKAHDDRTTIYGALWKPTNFDPNIKYPIIDHSYTGPHTQMYPKDFRRVLSVGNQALAELGFIVMMVDGLGSSGRSKSFHNYSYKNLGGNLADHIGAIRQLASRYNWIDTTRIGIFGHSAGGYDAGHAVLAYPDFYKVAVASSADHDHRMEKAWWPEMYMGWPVDSAYHLQSNITMAENLRGKLLITHGGIDENVNPSATFKLAEALIRADKQFDMLILPSQRHGYQGDHLKYFRKKRWNYFVKHLLGSDPIWDFEWD